MNKKSIFQNRYIKILIIILFLFIALPEHLYAIDPIVLTKAMGDYSIVPYIEIFEDKDSKISIHDLTGPDTASIYKWESSKRTSYGFTTSVYWIRFSISNPFEKQAEWYLEQAYPMIDYIDLYIPQEDGGYIIERNGDMLPFSKRKIKHRNPVFTVKEPPLSRKTYYLRYETNSALNIPLSIWTPNKFIERLNYELPIFWIYYGLLISMIVYNLFLLLSVKDINFLYYVLFIVFYMLFQMTLNGISFQYLWPNSLWWANSCLPLFMCLAYFWGTQFGRSIMLVRKEIPRFDKFFVFCLAMSVVGMIVALTAPYRIAIIFSTGFMVTVMITISCSFYLTFKGSRSAFFFAISWGGMALGIAIFALKTFGVFPHNFFTQWAIQIGSAWQAVLLAIGLTDQINTMKNKLQVLNVNLENKVIERTKDLQEARDVIWGEMQLAKKIQTVLLPDNPSIRGFEISTHMAPADEVGGDYYDVINSNGKDWVIIGDVSGHGVPAGLIMMMVQTSVRIAVDQNPDMNSSDLITLINRTLSYNIKQLNEDKYMTITVFAAHEDGKFQFSGLHQDIMVYRAADNKVDLIETKGTWIGILDDIDDMVCNDTLQLDVGDTILLYTDGITEAWRQGSVKNERDPETEMFGNDRLSNIFLKMGNESTDDIKNEIISGLNDYKCSDDVTMVVMKRLE